MTSTSGGATASAARKTAQTILAEARFHSPTVPRPLHGVLHAIGAALESPLNALDELVAKIGQITPGGSAVVWTLLALALVGLTALLSTRGARRALSGQLAYGTETEETAALSAAELEREANAAEREARYGEAVRYRFRAGLRTLADRELIGETPALVNAEISRTLRSPVFDTLAGRFEEIVYGGASADEQDAQRSRDEWELLLRSASRA
jgi:hypothetical protein